MNVLLLMMTLQTSHDNANISTSAIALDKDIGALEDKLLILIVLIFYIIYYHKWQL